MEKRRVLAWSNQLPAGHSRHRSFWLPAFEGFLFFSSSSSRAKNACREKKKSPQSPQSPHWMRAPADHPVALVSQTLPLHLLCIAHCFCVGFPEGFGQGSRQGVLDRGLDRGLEGAFSRASRKACRREKSGPRPPLKEMSPGSQRLSAEAQSRTLDESPLERPGLAALEGKHRQKHCPSFVQSMPKLGSSSGVAQRKDKPKPTRTHRQGPWRRHRETIRYSATTKSKARKREKEDVLTACPIPGKAAVATASSPEALNRARLGHA